MTNDGGPDRYRIADILNAWHARTLILQDENLDTKRAKPSLRSIERDTGIPHQRLSEYLRDPERLNADRLGALQSYLEGATTEHTYQGDRVTYFDTPIFTPSRLEGMRIPPNAAAFRFVVPTNEEFYRGMRSTEWSGDFDRIAELAEAVPGGASAIERIVFDTGEDF